MDVGVLLVSILAIVVGGLILAELSAWSPRVSSILASFAARRLAVGQRARYREEWHAHLEDMPTGLSKLVASFGFLIAAERVRVQTGWRAISAVSMYLRLRLRMLPYTSEARAFGGRYLAFQLKMQPCGNRHVFVAGLFPASASPMLDEYNETALQEAEDHSLDLSAERDEIVLKASQTDHRGPLIPTTRVTNIIIPAGRDPRPIRTLLVLLWRLRQRRVRRTAA